MKTHFTLYYESYEGYEVAISLTQSLTGRGPRRCGFEVVYTYTVTQRGENA